MSKERFFEGGTIIPPSRTQRETELADRRKKARARRRRRDAAVVIGIGLLVLIILAAIGAIVYGAFLLATWLGWIVLGLAVLSLAFLGSK